MINILVKIKERFGLKMWMIESSFVLLVLSISALAAGKHWVEWVGVMAVFYTFKHASVSNRMEEAEALRAKNGEKVLVDCYKKSTTFFYIKEALWFAYFAISGCVSALAGVIIFLLYPYWRKYYRRHYPLGR